MLQSVGRASSPWRFGFRRQRSLLDAECRTTTNDNVWCRDRRGRGRRHGGWILRAS